MKVEKQVSLEKLYAKETLESGGFDHSAMKSKTSSLKVVNWRTWPITSQGMDFSKGYCAWSPFSA